MNLLKTYQIFLIIILLFISFFTFIPSVFFGFSRVDDYIMVFHKSVIKADVKEAFFEEHEAMYHPLVTLSYAIETKLFGLMPEFFHLDNIFLHCINTILVLIIFILITKNFSVAYIVALLFAIHPLHTEVVAWISARKDTLYSIFYLFSIYFYIKSWNNKKEKFYILISFICFLLSCLSKVMAVTLPALLILLDFYSNKLNKQRIKIYLPFILVTIVFIISGIHAHFYNDFKYEEYSLFNKFLNAHFYILFYIVKLFLPINLYWIYPKLYGVDMPVPLYVMLSPIFLYIIIIPILYSLKYSKKIFFGFSFFIITVSPCLDFFPIGVAAMADRYVYIPLIGLSYILAEFFVYIYNKLKNKFKILLLIIGIIIICLFIYLSFMKTIDWKNNNCDAPVDIEYYTPKLLFCIQK